MPTMVKTVQTISISSALLGAGGIASLSLFDIPELKAQPADRSLPSIRWLFSRGSHIFLNLEYVISSLGAMEAVLLIEIQMVSAAGFLFLAYNSIPAELRSIAQVFKSTNGARLNGYVAAALLSFSLAPFTSFVMIPNNFALIKKNEEKGGARSSASAKAMREQGYRGGQRSAEDSVFSKGEASEFKDLSGPQSKTDNSSTEAKNQGVRDMLDKFAAQNMWRALLLGLGGVVGLATALS